MTPEGNRLLPDESEPSSSPRGAVADKKFLTEQMASWAFITVLLSLIQPALASLALLMHHQVPTLADLIGRGELLTATIGLSVYAVRSLFISGASTVQKLLFGGFAISVLLMATYCSATVGAAVRSASSFDHAMVAKLSLILHVIAIAIGTRCVRLSEKRRSEQK
jgi:hypothetical protein